jgi:hypothetical protein
MSETTTYKQTTFANVEKDIEQYEQQQAAPAQPQEPAIEATPAVVTESGVLEATPPTETQPTEAAPVVEENVSAFDLGEPSQPEVTQPQPTQSQPSFNWKDEIKKLDRKEIAKELGFHDFTLEMDEYLAKGGNAADYISAKGFDWNKISDEDLVKSELKGQFPDASDTQISRLYNKKFNQREEDIDEDKEDGMLLMKAEARKLREEKINKQNSFKIPEANIPPVTYEAEYTQWKQQQESQPALMKQLSEFYQNHEATKNLNQSKRVAINLGDGVPAFNFSINNPEALTRMFLDNGETWNKLTSTQSGEPDVPKQQLISLFSHNPQKFIQDIFNYGTQMGRKKMVDEGQNAQRPNQKAIPTEFNQTSYGVGKFNDKDRN